MGDRDETIRVLVIAVHALVQAGLSALLESEQGIAPLEAAIGVDRPWARPLPEVAPDVVLMYTSGEARPDSLDDVLTLLSTEPIPLVILGDQPEQDLPRLAQADLPGYGYLLHEADGPQIVEAVRAVHAGLVVLDRGLPLYLPGQDPESETFKPRSENDLPGETLTLREIDVLRLIAQGLPNKQIATRLEITEHTVKFHVSQILRKLDADSRTKAVTVGARRGYITL